MKRMIAMSLLIAGLTAGPLRAETKPDDLVGVLIYDTYNPPAPQRSLHTFKKWKDIKLGAQTMAALAKKIKELDKGSQEKFRVGFLMLSDEELQRVLFYGNYGGVVMMTWPPGAEGSSICALSFDGQGGFAAGLDPSCGGIGFR